MSTSLVSLHWIWLVRQRKRVWHPWMRRLVASAWGRVENLVSSITLSFKCLWLSQTFTVWTGIFHSSPASKGDYIFLKIVTVKERRRLFCLFGWVFVSVLFSFFFKRWDYFYFLSGLLCSLEENTAFFLLSIQPFLELGFSQLLPAKACSMRWWAQRAVWENRTKTRGGLAAAPKLLQHLDRNLPFYLI